MTTVLKVDIAKLGSVFQFPTCLLSKLMGVGNFVMKKITYLKFLGFIDINTN